MAIVSIGLRTIVAVLGMSACSTGMMVAAPLGQIGGSSLVAVAALDWGAPGMRPSRRALPPIRFQLVAAVWWPSAGAVHVALVWLTLPLCHVSNYSHAWPGFDAGHSPDAPGR